MYRKIIYLILFICAGTITAKAQLSIDFVPSISGSTIDGLLSVRIINVGESKSVRLFVTVDELDEGRMVSVETDAFTVIKGVSTIPQNVIRAAKVKIGTTSRAKFLQQNGYFPSGLYSYNYILTQVINNEILADLDFFHELEPPAPLNLVEPYDGDEVCEQRPLLSWQPSIPLTKGTQYQVYLVEVKDKQKAIEALNYNMPIISQRGVFNPLLMYPAFARALEKGKKYAWQVTAYVNQTVINRSEVWEFTVKCPDSNVVSAITDNGYRDIEDLAKGNFYVAVSSLKFSIVNSYEEQPLIYSITCVNEPSLKVKSLPKVQLKRGQNRIKLDFEDNRSFKEDYSYVMEVVLPNGAAKSLRFLYSKGK